MCEKFRNKYRIASHRKPDWDYSADALYFLYSIKSGFMFFCTFRLRSTYRKTDFLKILFKNHFFSGITIVTQNRICNLGEIVEISVPVKTNEIIVETHRRASLQRTFQMKLSDFGKIVETEWFKSFEIRKELFLHEFVIMPNHLHAIVEINNQNRYDTNNVDTNVETHGRASLHNDKHNDTHNDINDDTTNQTELLSIKRNSPKRMPKSISSFMAGFKSAVNTQINDYIEQHQLNLPKYNRYNHFFQTNYHDHIIRNYREYINISYYILQNPQNWNKDKFYEKNKSSLVS